MAARFTFLATTQIIPLKKPEKGILILLLTGPLFDTSL